MLCPLRFCGGGGCIQYTTSFHDCPCCGEDSAGRAADAWLIRLPVCHLVTGAESPCYHCVSHVRNLSLALLMWWAVLSRQVWGPQPGVRARETPCSEATDVVTSVSIVCTSILFVSVRPDLSKLCASLLSSSGVDSADQVGCTYSCDAALPCTYIRGSTILLASLVSCNSVLLAFVMVPAAPRICNVRN